MYNTIVANSTVAEARPTYERHASDFYVFGSLERYPAHSYDNNVIRKTNVPWGNSRAVVYTFIFAISSIAFLSNRPRLLFEILVLSTTCFCLKCVIFKCFMFSCEFAVLLAWYQWLYWWQVNIGFGTGLVPRNFLNQCGPISVSQYDVIRPQWVNTATPTAAHRQWTYTE